MISERDGRSVTSGLLSLKWHALQEDVMAGSPSGSVPAAA